MHPADNTSLAHSMFLAALDETIEERDDIDVKHLGGMLRELYELTACLPQVRAWLDAWVEGVFQRGEAA